MLFVAYFRLFIKQIGDVYDNIAADHDIHGFCFNEIELGRNVLFHKNIVLSIKMNSMKMRKFYADVSIRQRVQKLSLLFYYYSGRF